MASGRRNVSMDWLISLLHSNGGHSAAHALTPRAWWGEVLGGREWVYVYLLRPPLWASPTNTHQSLPQAQHQVFYSFSPPSTHHPKHGGSGGVPPRLAIRRKELQNNSHHTHDNQIYRGYEIRRKRNAALRRYIVRTSIFRVRFNFYI